VSATPYHRLCVPILILESEEFNYFEVFFDRPDRKLYPDYYKLIKNVVSLKSIQARVKRSDGGKNAPLISDFKSWGQFEHEMSFLWNNAWQYNEDGSEVSTLATELQVYQKAAFTKKMHLLIIRRRPLTNCFRRLRNSSMYRSQQTRSD